MTSKLQNIIERSANFNETNENEPYIPTTNTTSSNSTTNKTMNIITTFIENNNILLNEIDTITTQYNTKQRQFEEQSQQVLNLQVDLHLAQQYNIQLTSEIQNFDNITTTLKSDKIIILKEINELKYNNIYLFNENQKLKEKMLLYQY